MAFPLLAALATALSLVQSPPAGSWWERLPARPGEKVNWLTSGPDHVFLHGYRSTWGKHKDSSWWQVLPEPQLWESVFDGNWMIGSGQRGDFTPRATGTPMLVPGYWNPFTPDPPLRFLDDDQAWKMALEQLGKTPKDVGDWIDLFELRPVTGNGTTFLVYTRNSETMVLRVVDSVLSSGEVRKALRAVPLPRGESPLADTLLKRNGQIRPNAILGGVVLGSGKNQSQWRSQDTGKTWKEFNFGYGGVDIRSAIGESGDTLVAMLSDGQISRSFDRGRIWSTSSTRQPTFAEPPVLSRGNLWGIHQGNLLVSRNFGTSWTLARTGMAGLSATRDGKLLATSDSGEVLESNGKDSAWELLPDTLFHNAPGKIRYGSNRVVIGGDSHLRDLKILESGRWRILRETGFDDFEIIGDEFFASFHSVDSTPRDTVLPDHLCYRIRNAQGAPPDCGSNPVHIPYLRTWYSIARTRDFQTWDTIFHMAASPFANEEIWLSSESNFEFDPVELPGFAPTESSLLNVDSAGRLEIRLRTHAYRLWDGKKWREIYPTDRGTPPIDSTRVRVDERGDIHVLRSAEQTRALQPTSIAARWSIRGHRLSMDLARPSRVRVDRIDPLGRSATVLEELSLQTGRQSVSLGGRNAGVGIYRVWIDGAVAGQILSADPIAP